MYAIRIKIIKNYHKNLKKNWNNKNYFSSGTKIRNIILLVKDISISAKFYNVALGIDIKIQTENMIELDTGGTSVILKEAGYSAANLTTGYTPILTFDVMDMDHTISQALFMGAFLDGPMKYPAVGKVCFCLYFVCILTVHITHKCIFVSVHMCI